MAVRDDFTAGEVLAAADLNDTFASKADYPSGGSDGNLLSKSGTSTAWVAAPSAPGLVLITAEPFTSVSSVSVNGCFTSTYANYRILIYFTASNQTGLTLRFRASGSDDSGTNYQYQEFESQSTANTGARTTSATSASLGGTGADAGSHNATDIYSPQLSQRTGWRSHTYLTIAGAYLRDTYGQTTVTTAYDGFTLISGSGNFSGTVRVYGYAN